MSFSFCPFYKLLLKGDIKERIMDKINDIQVNSDWCQFDLCINNEDLHLSNLDCDQIKLQRNIWYSIAKLSIDLWLNYDHYRQFVFEGQYDIKEYKERLENLGFVYNSGKWESVRRPCQEVVLTNVFVYCLHQLMFRQMVDNNNICVYCDQRRESDNVECQCGASFEEITYLQQKIRETENLSGKKELLVASEEKEVKNKYAVEIRQTKKKDDKNVKKERISEERKSLEDNVNKWKCGKCGMFNEYSLVNCVACEGLYASGRWICTKCSMENECVNEQCSVCGEGNINVRVDKSREGSGSHQRIKNGRWRCGKCGLEQSYEVGVCSACEDARDTNGQWECTKCTCVNKCSSERCVACNSWNKYLIVKYCQGCKVHRLGGDDPGCCVVCKRNEGQRNGRWQCWYDFCRAVNRASDEYCVRCQLWRHNSQKRGDRAKQWCRDRDRHVWVCHRCGTVNDLNRTTCTKFLCRETRYKKSYCFKCDLSTEGTSNHCSKCSQRLR